MSDDEPVEPRKERQFGRSAVEPRPPTTPTQDEPLVSPKPEKRSFTRKGGIKRRDNSSKSDAGKRRERMMTRSDSQELDMDPDDQASDDDWFYDEASGQWWVE